MTDTYFRLTRNNFINSCRVTKSWTWLTTNIYRWSLLARLINGFLCRPIVYTHKNLVKKLCYKQSGNKAVKYSCQHCDNLLRWGIDHCMQQIPNSLGQFVTNILQEEMFSRFASYPSWSVGKTIQTLNDSASQECALCLTLD